MRTTVELTQEQRARLLELAARRGEKGFSKLVQEAIDAYLEVYGAQSERTRAAQSVLGTFDSVATSSLEEAFGQSRASWR